VITRLDPQARIIDVTHLVPVTHRPQDALADAGFIFVDGLDEAIVQAREAAGGGPGAPAPAPVTLRNPHHLSCAALTPGGLVIRLGPGWRPR